VADEQLPGRKRRRRAASVHAQPISTMCSDKRKDDDIPLDLSDLARGKVEVQLA
jgi:hypothetical protein